MATPQAFLALHGTVAGSVLAYVKYVQKKPVTLKNIKAVVREALRIPKKHKALATILYACGMIDTALVVEHIKTYQELKKQAARYTVELDKSNNQNVLRANMLVNKEREIEQSRQDFKKIEQALAAAEQALRKTQDEKAELERQRELLEDEKASLDEKLAQQEQLLKRARANQNENRQLEDELERVRAENIKIQADLANKIGAEALLAGKLEEAERRLKDLQNFGGGDVAAAQVAKQKAERDLAKAVDELNAFKRGIQERDRKEKDI